MARQDFADIVKDDYDALRKKVRLCAYGDVSDLLLMQSIEGHAQNGDCLFNYGPKYPEATMEDIVIALGHKPDDIKNKRQVLIYEKVDFASRIMAGEKLKHYVNRNNEPLFRIKFLEKMEISDLNAVLIGIFLGSIMDRYKGWRELAEQKYGSSIGGGECIGINRREAHRQGITLEMLAKEEHSDEEIDELLSKGILCRNVASSNDIVGGYIRHKKGKGTSDDLAVILAGKLYGFDAAIGLFLTDAIDTWDKYVPFIHSNGQDEKLGESVYKNRKQISENLKGFELPSKDECLKFINCIAESNYENVVSSSQRYFLQINHKARKSVIENHLGYIQGKMGSDMKVSHRTSGVTTYKMYKQFEAMYESLYSS